MDDHEDGEGSISALRVIVAEVTHHGAEERAEADDEGAEVGIIDVDEERLEHTAHDGHVAEQDDQEVEGVDDHAE